MAKFSLKSLFIHESEPETKEIPNATAASATEVVKPVTREDSNITPDGTYDPKILKKFQKVIEDQNISSYDFLEFQAAVNSMEKAIPDEVQRFTAAFAAGQAVKKDLTVKWLLETADQYKAILKAEEGEFKADAEKRSKEVVARVKQINEIEAQQKSLESQRTKLLKQNAEANAALASIKQRFYNTLNYITDSIDKTKSKIKSYVK